MTSPFKKNQYYAAKYNGHNGDLIVGRVESVRSGGDVLLTNLLTKNRSLKKESVLLRRNHKITKKKADQLVSLFRNSKKIAVVREMAVVMYQSTKNGVPTKKPDRSTKRNRLEKELISLATQIKEVAEKLEALRS